jgi:iron complex transport system substrate-binding protein
MERRDARRRALTPYDPTMTDSSLACSARALLLPALLSLTACGPGADAKLGDAPKSALPTISPAAGFPATVRSYTGTTVSLEKAPQRLIAGNASLLEIAIELIEPERMAALPSTAFLYSNLAQDPGPWKAVPVLPNFEAEALIAAGPDLILIQSYQQGSTVDRALEQGLPVVVMPVVSTWEEQLQAIGTLARIFGEDRRGSDFIAGLRTRAKALQAPAPRTGKRVLPYGNYGSGGMTAGIGSTRHVMIDLANMSNAASEAGLSGHPNVDFEQILAIDPDFFLISLSSATTGSSAESILTGEPLIANLRAIREKRFLRLPEALYSAASHEMLRAAESIAEQADALEKSEE